MRDKFWEPKKYNSVSEEILSIIKQRTQNIESDTYFRVLISFYLCQMASSMRCVIDTEDRGRIPVNTYALALMESGAGKGHSLNIMEDFIVNKFNKKFSQHTFPVISEMAIEEEALKKANRKGTDYDEELADLTKEFNGYGAMPYSFSEGTSPAYKQVRTKAQIAKIGSLNYICDEIGSNLLSAAELFTVCLEAYDVGKIKDKITKSSSDNVRKEQRSEPVPTNMLVFGTPVKVLNGAKEESEFMSLLETGYGRRFLFGTGSKNSISNYTPEALYDLLVNKNVEADIVKIANLFENLADPVNANFTVKLPRELGIRLLKYRMECEKLADTFPEHQHIFKAEMQHRYFKALKLAGAYAFVESNLIMTEDTLDSAIKVVEDSGLAFKKIMERPKSYERLATFIAEYDGELTPADLDANLPFYRGAQNKKNELLHLAIAWGYSNNIIIRKKISDNIEFISGESLKENDLTQIILSYSSHPANNYLPKKVPFSQLSKLTQTQGMNWCNHHFKDKHRNDENTLAEFNTIILDVDCSIKLDKAMELLKEYTAHYYTTKRHTATENRFRVVIPIKYNLKLGSADYASFIQNIFSWLPFTVDDASKQRSKKWLSHKGTCYNNQGKILDPTRFIPRTSKEKEYSEQIKNISSIDSLERWFLMNELVDGNRNNGLIKYALVRHDAGDSYEDAENAVKSLNSKLGKDALSSAELEATILKTLAKKY